LTLQLTVCVVALVTVAANCFVAFVWTLAVFGLTVTLTVVDCAAWPEFGSIINPETSTASKSDP
jgi:hypothetical protein